MGIVLDSSVTIAAERARESAPQLIRRMAEQFNNQPIALSAIGYTEIVQGLHRSTNPIQRAKREQFMRQLLSALPVYPYTQGTAELAGRLRAHGAATGFPIPFADLLIGATALSLGFSILTANERHFRLIPGLEVIAF